MWYWSWYINWKILLMGKGSMPSNYSWSCLLPMLLRVSSIYKISIFVFDYIPKFSYHLEGACHQILCYVSQEKIQTRKYFQVWRIERKQEWISIRFLNLGHMKSSFVQMNDTSFSRFVFLTKTTLILLQDINHAHLLVPKNQLNWICMCMCLHKN